MAVSLEEFVHSLDLRTLPRVLEIQSGIYFEGKHLSTFLICWKVFFFIEVSWEFVGEIFNKKYIKGSVCGLAWRLGSNLIVPTNTNLEFSKENVSTHARAHTHKWNKLLNSEDPAAGEGGRNWGFSWWWCPTMWIVILFDKNSTSQHIWCAASAYSLNIVTVALKKGGEGEYKMAFKNRYNVGICQV